MILARRSRSWSMSLLCDNKDDRVLWFLWLILPDMAQRIFLYCKLDVGLLFITPTSGSGMEIMKLGNPRSKLRYESHSTK